MDYSAFPGYDLIREGLRDRKQDRLTQSGLLVAIANPEHQ